MTVNHDVVGSSPTWGAIKDRHPNGCLFFMLLDYTTSWTRTGRRLDNWQYHYVRSRNQQPEWLLVSPRLPAAASPTWGAKKKSRSNDLLFLFVSELSSQSITCVSITMEPGKEAPAVVPTERPLRKQSGGLFLGRGP